MGEKGEKGKRRWPLWTLVICLLFFLVVLPCNIGIAPAEAIAAGKVTKLLFACRAYASDHSGRYPEKLSDLYPRYLEIEHFFSVSGKWGKKHDLIYHPGLTDQSPGNEILIETPVPVGGKRITGNVGGDVSMEDWE